MQSRALKVILSGVVALFLLACTGIALDGLNDHPHAADLAVVLGSKVNADGKPSQMLQARLDHAVLLYQDGYIKNVLVSGGIDRERHNEADIMADYLFRAGLPADVIFRDPDGADTFHTARNTSRFLRDHHLSGVLIVSQYFHMTRCKLAFRRFGISPIYTSHAPFVSWRDFYSLPREVFGCIEYYFRPVS